MSESSNNMRDIVRQALESGDVVGWFEQVYQNAENGNFDAPWSVHTAYPSLVNWFKREKLRGEGKTALVTGCGEGDDAEYLAAQGYQVTAFDVSETAIKICEQRFPDSEVSYQVADLFALPNAWHNAFDFVLDNRTVQALPPHLTEKAIRAEAATVADGGLLLMLCWGRDDADERTGVPWPLSRGDLQSFIEAGLTQVNFEELGRHNGERRFRVTYRKD